MTNRNAYSPDYRRSHYTYAENSNPNGVVTNKFWLINIVTPVGHAPLVSHHGVIPAAAIDEISSIETLDVWDIDAEADRQAVAWAHPTTGVAQDWDWPVPAENDWLLPRYSLSLPYLVHAEMPCVITPIALQCAPDAELARYDIVLPRLSRMAGTVFRTFEAPLSADARLECHEISQEQVMKPDGSWECQALAWLETQDIKRRRRVVEAQRVDATLRMRMRALESLDPTELDQRILEATRTATIAIVRAMVAVSEYDRPVLTRVLPPLPLSDPDMDASVWAEDHERKRLISVAQSSRGYWTMTRRVSGSKQYSLVFNAIKNLTVDRYRELATAYRRLESDGDVKVFDRLSDGVFSAAAKALEKIYNLYEAIAAINGEVPTAARPRYKRDLKLYARSDWRLLQEQKGEKNKAYVTMKAMAKVMASTPDPHCVSANTQAILRQHLTRWSLYLDLIWKHKTHVQALALAKQTYIPLATTDDPRAFYPSTLEREADVKPLHERLGASRG